LEKKKGGRGREGDGLRWWWECCECGSAGVGTVRLSVNRVERRKVVHFVVFVFFFYRASCRRVLHLRRECGKRSTRGGVK
jgi:hypothetical protein